MGAPSVETFKVRLDGAQEELDLVEDVFAHSRGIGLDGLQSFLPAQTILRVCEKRSWGVLSRAMPR